MTEMISVLHVEDDPEFAELVAIYLERADEQIEVRTATHPDQGISALTSREIDCIVSDFDMPGRNGIELLETVRKEHAELPFILFTGKGSEEIAGDAISAGVTDYLQKGSGTEQYAILANRIGNAVEQHRSRREVAKTERRLSELSDRTDDVLFIFDGGWDELSFINSAYEEAWGGSIETLERNPRAFLERVHPDDRESVRASMKKVLDGEPCRTEYRIVRPDGEQRWVRGNTRPIVDETGELIRIVGQVRDVTERKDRELHLETVIDNLPGYVYRHSYEPEYPLEYVKGDAESITGYTAAELEEDISLAEKVVHPDDRKRLWREHVERIESAGEFDSTYRIITKDGDVRWIRDQGQLVTDPVTGEAVIDGFIVDVSERIRRGQELERQQTFINECLDALQDIYYVLDENGRLIRWNERLPEVTGYEDETIDGMNVGALFAEEHRDRVLDSFETSTETGSATVQADLVTKSGRRIPYEFRETSLMDPNTGEPASAGVGRDVTEREEREAELIRQRSLLKAQFEATLDGILIADGEGETIAYNQQFMDLWGIPETIIEDGSYEERIDWLARNRIEEVETFRERVQELNDSPEERSRDEIDLTDSRTFERYSAPVADEDGTYYGRTWILRDITDSKEYEQRLEQQNEWLDEFTNIVSHDLRNPLNVAAGRLELVREECGSEHLDAVEQAHDRMGVLIESSLTLAREGGAEVNREPVAVETLARDSWRNVETGGASLVVETERTVDGDGRRLKQLFENLFRNSMEHGSVSSRTQSDDSVGHGEEGVTVTVGSLEDGFYVEDDGRGIPGEDREAVFDAGYSTTQSGTGFGLSIVERIVEIHGWDVRASEGADGGARFEITGVGPGAR